MWWRDDMGDTYWMEDESSVEWGKALAGNLQIFRKPNRPAQNKALFGIDSQIKDYIFQKINYSPTETGSQYLDPVWRHNIIKINSNVIKIQALISLN